MSKEDPSVKRVRPYPIDATLKVDGEFKKISVILLNTRGVIARTPNVILKVGAELEFTGELPVSRAIVSAHVKVVKTYDQAAQPAGIVRMAELHFSHLPADLAKLITRFMKSIGQTQ